jgi:chromosome segregation protein
LRTTLAWSDWQQLSATIDGAADQLASHHATLGDREAAWEAAQEKRQAGELAVQQAAEEAGQLESHRNELSRRIATLQGRREADQQALVDVERQIAAGRRRLQVLRSQAGNAVAELRDLRHRHEEAQATLSRAAADNQEAESLRRVAGEKLEAIRGERDKTQTAHLQRLREAADLEGALHRHQQRIDASQRSLEALELRVESATAAVEEAVEEVARCEQHVAQLDANIADQARRIDQADSELGQHRRVLQRRRDEASALRVRLQGLSERANLLEDLQRRQEGIEAGVKKLSEAAAQSPTGPLGDIVGMVANLIETDVHVAPLIDVALGPLAQYLVVRGDRLQRAIMAGELGLPGRVGILRVDELPARRPGDRIRLDGLKGVVGRADRLIRVEPQWEPLARHLLGTTWLVDTMKTAIGLRRLSGAGLRFVTGGCELLDRDGSLVLGPAAAASGLVSRRSELSAAQKELQHYRYQLQENEEESERLHAMVETQAAALGRLEQEHRQSVTQRAGAIATRDAAVEREASRRATLEDLRAQRGELQTGLEEARAQLVDVEGELRSRQQQIAELEQHAQRIAQQLAERQTELKAVTDVVMRRSVELARVEQRAEALQATLEQQQRDQSQRDEAVHEVRSQLELDLGRQRKIEAGMLEASSTLAELHLQCEAADRQMHQLAGRVQTLRSAGREQQKEVAALQKQVEAARAAVREVERRRDEAQLLRDNLAQRFAEDYQIDLAGEDPPADFEPPDDRAAAEQEISSLRDQLQNTGAVNMEALEELQQLQTRYDELHGQFQDLSSARDSLERIIQRINADSRRLFLDTLEAIRSNFQSLYRKSFGGGSADLILEEDVDPLEAGVEIMATPPGKPSFSNSLLSGGEKALTAVSLLMAIFQYRPSPFCVLDEVDAPFDEANIGRFVTVLTEFLDQSKFVVVTHSKKTMTAANTLYGVTMQESGVSKRVSVRFEDVDEQGHIKRQAA